MLDSLGTVCEHVIAINMPMKEKTNFPPIQGFTRIAAQVKKDLLI
jgi:hypothetical protein